MRPEFPPMDSNYSMRWYALQLDSPSSLAATVSAFSATPIWSLRFAALRAVFLVLDHVPIFLPQIIPIARTNGNRFISALAFAFCFTHSP